MFVKSPVPFASWGLRVKGIKRLSRSFVSGKANSFVFENSHKFNRRGSAKLWKFSISKGDDESLRRWKEKLLGSVEGDFNGQMDPEVRFSSLGISKDVEEFSSLGISKEALSGRPLFTLREGAHYRFKLTFTALHNIVSGLTCTNTI
ncbi:Rho GDP-dissociation inhibitor 1-like protein [Tanacetum coccineum]